MEPDRDIRGSFYRLRVIQEEPVILLDRVEEISSIGDLLDRYAPRVITFRLFPCMVRCLQIQASALSTAPGIRVDLGIFIESKTHDQAVVVAQAQQWFYRVRPVVDVTEGGR